jgi:inhibitor of cysteine peptidase
MRRALAAAVFGVAAAIVPAGAADATRTLRPGERFDVVLGTTAGTGYAWELSPAPPADVVRLTGTRLARAADAPPGASAEQTWTFEATGPGTATVTLVYRRPWETDVAPARTHTVAVTVER